MVVVVEHVEGRSKAVQYGDDLVGIRASPFRTMGEQSPLDLHGPIQGGKPFLVQDISLDKVLFQHRVRPAAEGDAALGIDAVADRKNDVQVINWPFAFDRAPTFVLNLYNFCTSCLLDQFFPVINGP